jgi:hypothetical protein
MDLGLENMIHHYRIGILDWHTGADALSDINSIYASRNKVRKKGDDRKSRGFWISGPGSVKSSPLPTEWACIDA